MATHALNSQRITWAVTNFPPEISSWKPTSNNPQAASPLRPVNNNTVIKINGYAAQAVVAYVKKENADIALVDTGSGTYSAEKKLVDQTIVATMNRPRPGVNTLVLRAASVTATNAYVPLPPLRSSSETDVSPIFLCLLAFVLNERTEVADDMSSIAAAYAATGSFDNCELAFWRVVDTLTFALDASLYVVSVPGSNIDLLSQQSVTLGSLNGSVICGSPQILTGTVGSKSSAGQVTFAEAKKEFQAFASQHTWTEEEQALIPVFPEDYRVPWEALSIARFYVRTKGNRRPMVNFMWRGVTSYGKSNGVELIAGFLKIPLLRVTCHTTMETQDFLSDFVPDTSAAYDNAELPSFMEIMGDPETAYKKLTGISDENATGDDCLRAYGEVCAARSGSGTARFKHVESNFVRALAHGYIVEVQEVSRIKDPGVLVGLNEFDRPGAIIPLVDGSFTRRHPDAMVIFTDNIGYASCRAIDPSVLRRMSFIFDSYDLPKKDVIARVLYNTDFPDREMLDSMYEIWKAVSEYCAEHDISEGSISVTELEMWALSVKVDGMSNLKQNCRYCVVAKATSDRGEQNAIMADVVDIRLS